MRNPFADSYHWSKRIWAPNPFVVLLRKAQTDLAVRIWTILVPIRLKKPEKNGFGPFSYKFFVCIRVGLREMVIDIHTSIKVGTMATLRKQQVCVVCFLPIYSERQVRWMYQPGSHRRKVTQDFSSTFLFGGCLSFFSREGFSRSVPSSTVESNFVY